MNLKTSIISMTVALFHFSAVKLALQVITLVLRLKQQQQILIVFICDVFNGALRQIFVLHPHQYLLYYSLLLLCLRKLRKLVSVFEIPVSTDDVERLKQCVAPQMRKKIHAPNWVSNFMRIFNGIAFLVDPVAQQIMLQHTYSIYVNVKFAWNRPVYVIMQVLWLAYWEWSVRGANEDKVEWGRLIFH